VGNRPHLATCCSVIEPPAAPATVEAICLACRTVFPSLRPCDAGRGHAVVSLATEEGRARLVRETWGHFARRQRLARLVRRDLARKGPLPGDDEAGIYGGLDVGLFFISVVYAVMAEIVDYFRSAHRRRRFLRCYGARSQGIAVRGLRPTYGAAEGDPTPSPLRGEACLAFAVILRSSASVDPSADVLWREAIAPRAFDVRLDDGSVVRVPAGPLRFEPDRAHALRASIERARQRLPPALRDDQRELAFVPFDEALEDVVRPGDRVVLTAAVERVEDRSTPRPSLRSPAQLALVASAPVVLRKM